MASNGKAGVRFETVAAVGTSTDSAGDFASTTVAVPIVLSPAPCSAVGAARISTTPIKHSPIAAAAGNAAGSTKRAPTESPKAAPPKSETHRTIDFHIG